MWDATTFTKNRDRLLAGDVADAFFAEVLAAIKADGLLSDEHFTVDGTLLEAWASHKSFKPKEAGARTPPDDPKNPTVNFHGETRRNDTHQSTTDPDARLYKKAVGREAKLGYLAHLLTENRHGLHRRHGGHEASGTAERDAAIVDARRAAADDAAPHGRPPTKRTTPAPGSPPSDGCASRRTWPRTNSGTAAARSTRARPDTSAIAVSHRKRKLIEQAFGWLKTVALFRKLRHRGGRLVDWLFSFGAAAYNLVRWRNLVAQHGVTAMRPMDSNHDNDRITINAKEIGC